VAVSPAPKGAGAREATGAGAPVAPGLSPLLFVGIVVASIGGPLALVALQIPASSEIASRVPWVTLAGTLLFLAPIAVWCGYARRIVSAGGLTAYVEEAAGRRVALAQGALWIVSYALYMVYTIPQVVYEMLPAAVPLPATLQPVLAIAIAGAVGGVALLPLRWAVSVTCALALVQIILVFALSAAVLPYPASAAPVPPGFGAAALATAQASLFYVCGSLPLFLGAEVRGGGRVVSRGLLAGFAVAAVVVLIGVAAVTRAGIDGDAAMPGQELAVRVGAPGLGVAVGVGAAVSTCVIILAEFLALTRLVHHLFVWPVRRVTAVMAAALVVGTAVTLVNPITIYEALLKPSLIALWLSQVIVFAVYPMYRARTSEGPRRSLAGPIGVAAVASAIAVFGLISVTILPAAS
jgi:hypothetical protein